ncbi:hypothetical protein ES702_01964 [subsurface metagenome]
MPNLPSLALARKIVKAFLVDDFMLLIIYGTPRIGKSAYGIKVMGQVIDYLFGEDIFKLKGSEKIRAPICQKYMGWDPEYNVNRWIDLYKRIPGYIWDDAGYWLFSLNWTDPLLITVQQYMNVVGTDMNSLMLTTPDPEWILSKIATMPGTIRVRITKRDGGRSDADSKLFSRLAVGYLPYKYPDLKKGGVNKVLMDEFSCKLPEPFYSKWYKPTRESYARIAKLAMREELKRRNEARQRGKKRRGRPRKE